MIKLLIELKTLILDQNAPDLIPIRDRGQEASVPNLSGHEIKALTLAGMKTIPNSFPFSQVSVTRFGQI